MHKVTILLWVFIFLQSCSESENKNKVSNSETISSISDTLDGNLTSFRQLGWLNPLKGLLLKYLHS